MPRHLEGGDDHNPSSPGRRQIKGMALDACGAETMEDRSQGIELGILGPFEVRASGRPLDIGSAKQRVLLAALAVRAGHPVPLSELAEAIWGDAQPGNPRRAVQLHVTRLRRLLADRAA